MSPVPYRDPIAAFLPFALDHHAALFDRGAVQDGQRFSTIAADPARVISATRGGVFVDDEKVSGDPFSVLAQELTKIRCPAWPDLPAPFVGGVAGFFGYELGGFLERLPPPRPDRLDLPLMVAGVYDTVAVFDHRARRAWVVSHAADADAKAARLASRLAQAPEVPPPLDWTPGASWQAELGRAAVEANIQRVIEYIYAGDIFQANYTQRFTASRPPQLGDFDIYRRLRALSPAPFATFLRCGPLSIASATPERFLRLDPDGRVVAEPIKGTRPRHADPARDAAQAEELRGSVKDHAENLMIVDLMRNDLGRVCDIGSVRVPQLCALETFASVHHLVSRVEGRLRAGLGPVDLLRATFPGGSITGAPKIRAMEIIHELEPAPRGAYCGCLGWIGADGAMDMSMTIRTLTLAGDTIVAQAGGGIVADSDPSAEYEESMVKIAPLLRAVIGGGAYDHGLAEQRTGG